MPEGDFYCPGVHPGVSKRKLSSGCLTREVQTISHGLVAKLRSSKLSSKAQLGRTFRLCNSAPDSRSERLPVLVTKS